MAPWVQGIDERGEGPGRGRARVTVSAQVWTVTNLRDEPYKDHHADAGDDVSMILDDKLMAEDRRALLVVWSP